MGHMKMYIGREKIEKGRLEKMQPRNSKRESTVKDDTV